MSQKSTVPDAWDDDWETLAATPPTSESPAGEDQQPKKVSSRVTKAQRRAQQAEFNRQLWLEAEGPKETNYFLETRQTASIPLKNEFKPPPILLSRKGPPVSLAKSGSLESGVGNLSLNADSSDEEGSNAPALTMEERVAKAAKEREEKQRRYEERREQLFGPSVPSGSGNSSSADVTPPSSRSGTPSRGRGGRGRGGVSGSRNQSGQRREYGPKRELFDPSYTAKPDSNYVQQRKDKSPMLREGPLPETIQPVRAPRGPDGSGRGGFGFASRGGAMNV